MELIFVRHGEAESNIASLDRKVGAPADLTERGREQAERVAREVGKLTTEKTIYCSPFPRTLQTAEIIAARNNFHVVVDNRLKEINKGDWEGLPVSQVMEMEARIDADERHSFRPPGGENWQDVADRMNQFVIDRQINDHKQIVAVSHDHPIRMLTGYLLGRPIVLWEDMEVSHASVTILANHAGEWRLTRTLSF